MAQIHGYIQNKQTKCVLYSGGLTQENAEHFLTSRGLSLADHKIVLDAKDEDITAMVNSYNESIMTYANKRDAEYPDWKTQMDKIYHEGIDAWKADMIKPVKDKYPKE